MPASKVTWVRREGFSKYIASVRPLQCLGPLASVEHAPQLARAREHLVAARRHSSQRPSGKASSFVIPFFLNLLTEPA